MAYMTVSQLLALQEYERYPSPHRSFWWVETLSNGVLEVGEYDAEAQENWGFLILPDGTTTTDWRYAPLP